ncbi:hypothetical protein ACFQ75_13620 [Bacillus subtilis]
MMSQLLNEWQNGPFYDGDHARLLAKSKSGGKMRMVGSRDKVQATFI